MNSPHVIQSHVRASTEMCSQYQGTRGHATDTHSNHRLAEINTSFRVHCKIIGKGILGIQPAGMPAYYLVELSCSAFIEIYPSLVYSPEETIFGLRSIRAWLNNE